ncbi:hypothetical protein BD410DRAFT_768227 [Rickenella mellea]|uniref:P-loop containing nucleoside triphosphate hydrolase protein n=1 Tax=Rickenella mellea TaxID=50990 RepID=A0A4Y7QA30_9AGAM|nr:hypothetical protein BD410DRAFT_768227 [Rickenella mellea]
MNDTSHTNIQDFLSENRVMLVLVGLIASGKSTFAQALEEHVPRFRRCNQDDLGNRKAVERLARQTLEQGLSVCVDRTNIDETQRGHWVNIAKDNPGTAIWCMVFDTPINICTARLLSRTNHPTIKSPEQGMVVLNRFASELTEPLPHEGFEHIFYLRHSDHRSPSYTKTDVLSILERIRLSPLCAPQEHFLPLRSEIPISRGRGSRARRIASAPYRRPPRDAGSPSSTPSSQRQTAAFLGVHRKVPGPSGAGGPRQNDHGSVSSPNRDARSEAPVVPDPVVGGDGSQQNPYHL